MKKLTCFEHRHRWVSDAAYYRWESMGKPWGHDLDFWLIAEADFFELQVHNEIRINSRKTLKKASKNDAQLTNDINKVANSLIPNPKGWKKYSSIVQNSALAAGGFGVPGSILPMLDVFAMVGIWGNLVYQIAKKSGHNINFLLATKIGYSIALSVAAYWGGSRAATWLFNLIPGAGTIAAATINAAFNYAYTLNIGKRLVMQFDRPDFNYIELTKVIGDLSLKTFTALSHHDVSSINNLDGHEYHELVNTNSIPDNIVPSTEASFSTISGILPEVGIHNGQLLAGYTSTINPLEVQAWAHEITTTSNHPFIPVITDPNAGYAFIEVKSPAFGDEFIHYSPDMFNHIKISYGDGALYGILAHEVGHSQVGFFNFDNMPADYNEWRADWFSGSIMASYNHGQNGINEYLKLINDNAIPDQTHGNAARRIGAVVRGFLQSGGNPLLIDQRYVVHALVS